MIGRRYFLSGLGFSFFSLGTLQKLIGKNITSQNKPIVVSTWDSGLQVNEAAWEVLQNNGRAVDAAEQGAKFIEDTIDCCVGLGGNPDRDGFVTLDACIMDEYFNCGSVAFLRNIKHPISVARKIMEQTPHVMLVGEGALKFALENGFKKEPDKLSPDAEAAYKEWLKTSEYKPVINIEKTQQVKTAGKKGAPAAPPILPDGSINHDTMGTIAMDKQGNLGGTCTTSGMGFKMHGRVGDSPIIGAGLYVDNEVGAVTCSGKGEEVIRVCGSHLVVQFMSMGYSPELACKKAIEKIVGINPAKSRDFQVGFIAINKQGEYGAYSIQPGFSYAVTDMQNPQGIVLQSQSYYS
jgi:N4-(beta-N-acetylglucosaminyl)-L-asparaginase